MASFATKNSVRLAMTSSLLIGILSLAKFATAEESVPDFELLDVNETSATHNEMVSPRDFLGRGSGCYFGWAT